MRPFVYPYDLRDGISQVSGGELYALHTLVVDIQVAVTGWVMPQVSSPHFTYILHMFALEGAWGSFHWNAFHSNISSGCS